MHSTNCVSDILVNYILVDFGLICLPPLNSADMERELTLHEQDSLLGIRAQLHHQRENISCIFQLRHRRANGPDGRRPPAPPPSKPRAPPSAFALPPPARSRSIGPPATSSLSMRMEADLFLVEVSGDSNNSEKPNGLVASLTELFDRTYPNPIKLGVIEKMVGPPPNILVNKVSSAFL